MRYLKYSVNTEVRLTQLDETINQLNTIKYPTKQLKVLKENLEWIKNDFKNTINMLNTKKDIYNKNNLQLFIDFI